MQCALLYTTAFGERRIRVLTLGFKVTSSVASLFRYADLDALTNILMRQAALATAKQTLHQVREAVVTATVSILYTYRKMCASSTAAGQLILPESLKLLPLYALSLTKHALLAHPNIVGPSIEAHMHGGHPSLGQTHHTHC